MVDVPGYTMDQINVQFTDNVLTLAGEQPVKAETNDAGKQGDEDGRCHIVGADARLVQPLDQVPGASSTRPASRPR